MFYTKLSYILEHPLHKLICLPASFIYTFVNPAIILQYSTKILKKFCSSYFFFFFPSTSAPPLLSPCICQEIKISLIKFNPLQVGKVYYISRCQLKPANKKFSNLNNDYEMTFSGETQVVPCQTEDDSIPQLKFNFVPLQTLADTPEDTIVGKTINPFHSNFSNLFNPPCCMYLF